MPIGMTLLLPRSDDPQLSSFVEPFGRLLLAYGRANTAVINLAMVVTKDETAALNMVEGHNLTKVVDLFRDTVDAPLFKVIERSLLFVQKVRLERNRLLHGEWWFNLLDEGSPLQIRHLERQSRKQKERGEPRKIVHAEGISPEGLHNRAEELDAIADTLDPIAHRLTSEYSELTPSECTDCR